MKTMLAIGLLLPTFAFAQNRQVLETRVVEAMRAARQAVNDNLQKMSDSDLRLVELQLQGVRAAALGGMDSRPTPVPQPNPRPVPRPQPTYYTCAQQGTEAYQAAFSKIKTFAYSPSGLDMTSQGATNFAQNWTNRYPCELAGKYVTDMNRLRAFAYSPSGLDLSSAAARDYAIQNIGRICTNINYEEIHSKHYQLAYSPSGMDMSAQSAHTYARIKYEEEALRCNNGF